jgi:hypothetical protein
VKEACWRIKVIQSLSLSISISQSLTYHPPSTPTSLLPTTENALHPIHSPLPIPAQRALSLNRPPLLILAAALSAVDPFLGDGVAERLREPALAHLPAHEAVDAILGCVDLLVARDFGLVEVFWRVGE